MLGNTSYQNTSRYRPFIIRQLIAEWFTWFVLTPYPTSWNNTITAWWLGNNYEVLQSIASGDALDQYLSMLWDSIWWANNFEIPSEERSSRTGIYIFKNSEELKNIWYQVISHRTRENKDAEYRRFNISQAFALFHNVRIILPGEKFTFLDAIQFDEMEQKNYKKWYVIVDGEEIKEYGGGICGASTAVYQWILTNKSLEPTRRKSHTKRFGNLYPATINGKYINTPGIDSAIYAGQIDLHFRNTGKHPIILVANYDGAYGGTEEVFTLGYIHEQGSFEFLHGWYIRRQERKKYGTWTKSVRWWCYTRKINGKEKTDCYKEVY